MSKETVIIYRCDGCGRDLSNPSGALPHLSMTFSGRNGRVAPQAAEQRWKFIAEIKPGIYQFCNTICLASWMDAELVESINAMD